MNTAFGYFKSVEEAKAAAEQRTAEKARTEKEVLTAIKEAADAVSGLTEALQKAFKHNC